MGTSKTALFLDTVVAAALPVFDEVVAVQRVNGPRLAVRTIFEEQHEGEGALYALARALRDATGRCFILAVDYPKITTELLEFLASRFVSSPRAALIPEWRGRPQYLCGGYDASLLPLAEARLAEGAHEVSRFVAAADAEIIEERLLRSRFAGEPLLNINTPEELQEAESIDV